jgi:hypothetical protein
LPVALSSASARPLGITTIIGTATLSAIRLSKRASGVAKRKGGLLPFRVRAA